MLGAVGSYWLLDTDRFDQDLGWRIAFFIGPVLGLFIIYLRRHIPESPRWLVTHGRGEEAEKIVAGIEHDERDLLLTKAAYAKATDRVTGYRIAATRTDGDTATVTAYLRQAGRDVSSTFTLDKTGTDWGVFPVWELEAPKLGAVDVSARRRDSSR